MDAISPPEREKLLNDLSDSLGGCRLATLPMSVDRFGAGASCLTAPKQITHNCRHEPRRVATSMKNQTFDPQARRCRKHIKIDRLGNAQPLALIRRPKQLLEW